MTWTNNFADKTNTGNNEWYTPKEYVEAARRVMGGIKCDPASSEVANRVIKAESYYTKNTNGLSKPWGETVWMNPPYERKLIKLFCDKMVEKLSNKEVSQACVMVNASTQAKWFQKLLSQASSICFVNKRISFIRENGEEANLALVSQVILYFGSNQKDFEKEFKIFGETISRRAN